MTQGELRARINNLAESGSAKRWAVAVQDFQRDERFDFGGDALFHAASTMKVAVLLAVYRAIDEGKLRANDPLHVRNRFRSAATNEMFRLSSASAGYADLYKLVGRTARAVWG